jgi:hypothetical protein
LWTAGVALGVVAESLAFGWDDPLHWLPDIAVGWTFIGCGLVAMGRWPGNNTGVLMAATGFTWFLGNFAGVDNQVVAWVAVNGIFVHRGPLVHLVLAYPVGRLPGRLERAAAGVGYGTAFVPRVGRNDVALIILASLLLLVSARGYFRAIGTARRARLLSLRATAGLSSVLIAVAVASLAAGTAVGRPVLLAYQIALVAIGGGLFGGLLSGSWERADVADLVVELGEARSGTLRGELSRALGDPSLEVGYWVADADAFITAEGRALSLPGVDSERSLTMVRRGDDPVAAIVHDPTVLDDPGLSEAVAFAARSVERDSAHPGPARRGPWHVVRVRAADAVLVGAQDRGPDHGQDRRQGRGDHRPPDRAAALLPARTDRRDLGALAPSRRPAAARRHLP